jgi:hypothetical protein
LDSAEVGDLRESRLQCVERLRRHGRKPTGAHVRFAAVGEGDEFVVRTMFATYTILIFVGIAVYTVIGITHH